MPEGLLQLAEQLADCHEVLFQDIAARPSPSRRRSNLLVIVLAHYHNLCAGEGKEDFSRGCDPIHPAHFNVHQHTVGSIRIVCGESFRAVHRLIALGFTCRFGLGLVMPCFQN